MDKPRRANNWGRKTDFTCIHCQKQFTDYDYYTFEYCSRECAHIYEPISTRPLPVTSVKHKRAHKYLRQYHITKLREAQGIHAADVRNGITDNLSMEQEIKIKNELKVSWLQAQKAKKNKIKHLSKQRIDEIIQGHFEMLQSIMFLGNLFNDTVGE